MVGSVIAAQREVCKRKPGAWTRQAGDVEVSRGSKLPDGKVRNAWPQCGGSSYNVPTSYWVSRSAQGVVPPVAVMA